MKFFKNVIPLILFIPFIFTYYFLIQVQDDSIQNITEMYPNKPLIIIDKVFSDDKTVLWPSLTGSDPEFKTSSGFLGLGWAEFPAYEIKKKLMEVYNLKIINWPVTPSRLEAEMRLSRRPVCFFPYKMQNSQMKFLKDPKFLYSVGLEFSGDQSFKILIRKGDKVRFEKFINKIGILQINDLVNDISMKTNIILGKTYHPDVMKIFNKSNENEFSLKDRFNKNFTTMVASENYQLLQMLNKKRIDYIFNELIQNNFYKKINLRKDDFESLVYERNAIKSIDDNNLTHHVVKCNLHKLNFSLLPAINKIIKEIRSNDRLRANELYREKLDNDFVSEIESTGNIMMVLISQIGSGEIDNWFDRYILSYFPQLKSELPLEKSIRQDFDLPDFQNIGPPISRKNELNVIESNNTIFLLTANDIQNISLDSKFKRISGEYFPSYYDVEPRHLSYMLSDAEKIDILDNYKSATIFDFNNKYKRQYKKLVVNLYAANPEEVKSLFKLFPNIESIKLIFPNYKISKTILTHLPEGLRNFAVIKGRFASLNLPQALKKYTLEELELVDTYLDADEMNQLLYDHASSLKKLNLNSFKVKDKVAKTFSKLSWPELQIIDLNRCNLSGEAADDFISGIPKDIEEINLFENFLSGKQTEKVISQFKSLKIIKISDSYFIKESGDHLKFPHQLQLLALPNNNIDESILRRFILPNSLKHLIINDNPLNDEGLRILGSKKIRGDLITLSIGRHANSQEGSHNLFFDKDKKPRRWTTTLENLNASSSKISDSTFIHLSKYLSKLKSLDLNDNLISDESFSNIFTFKKISHLNLGGNFISSQGYAKLIKMLPKSLRNLNISKSLNIDPDILLHKNLTQIDSLNISRYSFTDNEKLFLLHYFLQKNIFLEIDVANDIVKNRQIVSKFAPNKFNNFRLYKYRGTYERFTKIIGMLPNQMNKLSFGIKEFTDLEINPQKIPFPNVVHEMHIHIPNTIPLKFKNAIFKSLPSIVTFPQIYVSNLEDLNTFLDLSMTKFSAKNIHINYSPEKGESIKFSLSKLKHLPVDITKMTFSTGTQMLLTDLENINKFNSLWDFGFFGKISIKGHYDKRHFLHDPSMSMFWVFTQDTIDNTSVDVLKSLNLRAVKTLSLVSNNMSGKSMTEIIKRASPDLYYLAISSTGIKYNELDILISALPPTLFWLEARGLNIGEKGYEKLRQWKSRQERLLRHEINLIE